MTREEREKAIDALKISAPVMAVTQEEFNDYIQTLNKIMNWLEQEPCGDVISRQAAINVAIDAVDDWDGGCNLSREEYIRNALMTVKPVAPAEKVGKWIEHFDESGKWYECDQCHTDWGGSVNYCPNCGAKMQEVQNDN